jgi:hypothetical protein
MAPDCQGESALFLPVEKARADGKGAGPAGFPPACAVRAMNRYFACKTLLMW